MIFLDTYSFCHSRIVHLVPKKKDERKIIKQKKWKNEKSFIHFTLVKGHGIVFQWNDHECKSRKKKENFFCIYITLKNGHDIVDLQMKSP